MKNITGEDIKKYIQFDPRYGLFEKASVRGINIDQFIAFLDDLKELANTVGEREFKLTTSSILSPDLKLYNSFIFTNLSENLTISNPIEVPFNGHFHSYRIRDNNIARTLVFGNKFRGVGEALPTITIANKTLYIGVLYNADEDYYEVTSKSVV